MAKGPAVGRFWWTQAADDLTAGRWNDIPNAISPVTVTADELRKFYRIRP